MAKAKAPKSPQPSVPQFPFGYRHGMTQPSALLTFRLARPGKLDPALLDQRLEEAFQLKMLPLARHDRFPVVAERMVAEIAWRIIQLGNALLRAVKIPALDPGCVVCVRAIQGSNVEFNVDVAIPIVEHIQGSLIRRAHEIATRSLLSLVRNRSGDPQLQLHSAEIDRIYVSPVYELVAGGRSTVPLLTTVHKMDIPFRHLGSGVYQLGWGCNAVFIDRSSIQSDTVIGAKLSNHKLLSATVIRSAGLPAPRHIQAATEDEVLAAARTLGLPVVVKPADRDRGEGVSVDIRGRKALLEAFNAAAQFSKSILVERQVSGVCHRLFVSHGKLLFAVKRRPKSVIGDGVLSVAALIEQANAAEMAKPPWLRLKPFPTDAMAVESLSRVGLTLASIPQPGQYAPLRSIQSTHWGGVVEEVTDSIHPDNVAIATQAAALFRLASAGIDLISEDISQPWHSNGAIINEINFSPLLTDESVAGGYLPAFIAETVKGDGRIPIEVFVGGKAALDSAMERQQELAKHGAPCYLTSDTLTLQPNAVEQVFSSYSLFERSTALLMNRSVGRLIMVIHSDELLQTGLPVDRVTGVTIVDRQLSAWNRKGADPATPRPAVNPDVLFSLLDRYTFATEVS